MANLNNENNRKNKKNYLIIFLQLILFSPVIYLISSSLIFLIGLTINNSFNPKIIFTEYLLFYLFFSYLIIKSKILENNFKVIITLYSIFFLQIFIFFISFKDSTFPHHAHDASNHIFMIKRIRELNSLDTKVLNINPVEPEFLIKINKEIKPWYPLGFHTGAGFLCELFNKKNCVRLPWYLVWIYASCSTYLMYFFTKEFFKNKLIGLVSSFFLTIFYLFPYMPFGWGGFTQISGLVLLLTALIFYKRFFKSLSIYAGITAALISVSVFYVHTTDFLTLFLTTVILNLIDIFFILKNNFKKGSFLLFFLILIIGILILPGYLIGHTSSAVKLEYPPDFKFGINDLNFLFKYHLIDVNNNLITFVFFIIGLIVLIDKRKIKENLPLIIGFIFFSLLVVFLRYWNFFQKITSYFYPWGQFERIMYTIFIFYLPIFSFGLWFFLGRINFFKRFFLFLILIAFYLNSLFLTINHISYLNKVFNPVTKDDIKMFDYINKNKKIFENKIFFNNPFNDAGVWLYELTGVKTFFPTATSVILSEKGRQFLYTFYNKNPDEICQTLKENKVDYILKGSKNIPETDTFFDDNKLKRMKCLKINKRFGEAYLFELIK